MPYAVRGGLVNVTVYDDRLEIVSSGNLASGLCLEKPFAPCEHLPPNPRAPCICGASRAAAEF